MVELEKQKEAARGFTSELYALLESRRSIRSFKDQPIPRETLERLLEAASHAPSGKNTQNWRFFVLTGDRLKDYLELTKKAWDKQKASLEARLKPSLYKFTENFFFTLGNAPAVIFFYATHDPDVSYKSSLGSVYMAMQNLIVAGLAEGIGSCPMGSPLQIEEDVNAFLNVAQAEEDEGVKLELICTLVLGYPNHEPPKAPRKMKYRVHWV